MIRDPDARISIMATGATHARLTGRIYDRNRSLSYHLHPCTRAGSIYDKSGRRSRYLVQAWFRVIRFWDSEVLKETDAVVRAILGELSKSSNS